MNDDAQLDDAVEQEVTRLWIREAARQRFAEEQATVGKDAGAFSIVTSGTDCERSDSEEWLIERILPAGAIVLLTAQHKTGKSSLLLNVAHSLVRGARFLDYTAHEYTRKVLYVNADMAAPLFRKWLRAIGSHENLLVLHGAPDVADRAVTRSLAEQLRLLDVGVVIFDVWGAVYGGDENDNASVRAAANNIIEMRAIAGLDAAIISHHAGWSADAQTRARGASALPGAVDVLWALYSKDGQVRFKNQRGRIAPTPEVPVYLDPRTWQVATRPFDYRPQADTEQF